MVKGSDRRDKIAGVCFHGSASGGIGVVRCFESVFWDLGESCIRHLGTKTMSERGTSVQVLILFLRTSHNFSLFGAPGILTAIPTMAIDSGVVIAGAVLDAVIVCV